MIPIDIDRTAMLLITSEGKDAYRKACERSLELAKAGDLDGSSIFFDVARAVLRLQNTSNDNESI